MLRYLTSGESHGRCLLTILEGMPAGLVVDKRHIDNELKRRMFGYGRGKRMSLEADKVEILSGLRKSVTIGSPIALMIPNVDRSIDSLPAVLYPRPGHADLAGALKYDLSDVRSVLERSSARETAARVSVGAVCKELLTEFGIKVTSHVIVLGAIAAKTDNLSFDQIVRQASKSPVRCADRVATELMCMEIDRAAKESDTLGGAFEVIVKGVPPGLGSHAQWDRRLDAILAGSIMSIQAIKGVSLGIGFGSAIERGSKVHDEIFYSAARGFFRQTNNAGGIEGGMTNGEHIVMQAAMKPIPTLRRPLASVNIKTKKAARASVERSDVCAVPSAGIVAEAVVAVDIANAMIAKFGGDSIKEMKRNYKGYLDQIRKF